MSKLTRRSFVKSAGAAGIALTVFTPAASVAVADDAPLAEVAADKHTHADYDWASQVTEELSCDVLIVGGGFSGTCCAVQAGELGLKVIMAEGQSFMGGNGLGIECTNAYGIHPNTASTTLGEMVAFEAKEQAYTTNQMFVRDMVSHAGENVQWLIDNGVQYTPQEDIDPAYLEMYKEGRYRAQFSFDFPYANGAAGQGFFPAMKGKLYEYGVNIRLATRVRALIKDGEGRVAGAYATDEYGDVVKINAATVVIATGGFGEDEKRWADLGIDINDIRIIGTAGHYGDGVNMAIEAGAIYHGAPAFGCTNIIGSAGAWGPIWDKLCWGGACLWVDIHGERFSDEAVSTYTHNFELANVPVRLAGGTCWSVMDADVYEYMLDGDEEARELFEEMLAEGDDCYKADSLEELADIMGVDKDLFLAQVEQYNASVAAGMDLDYGKDPQYLMPIATAPFYGSIIRGALEGLYSGGVKTNRHFHVMLPGRDKAFENLFAIGADGGMLYNFVYGLDINGSMSCHGLNSARTAAKESAAFVAAGSLPVAAPAKVDPQTAVKTIVNELAVANDLNITAADSPCTVVKGEERFAHFFNTIEAITGQTIDEMEMVVKVTESYGAEIAATHEIPIVYNYTLQTLSGVIDGQAVSWDK